MTLSTGGFRQVVAFPPAPIATGWSDPCREGLAPSQEPCLSTAHDFTITTPELRFSVRTTARDSYLVLFNVSKILPFIRRAISEAGSGF
jgi:hypothetical protein